MRVVFVGLLPGRGDEIDAAGKVHVAALQTGVAVGDLPGGAVVVRAVNKVPSVGHGQNGRVGEDDGGRVNDVGNAGKKPGEIVPGAADGAHIADVRRGPAAQRRGEEDAVGLGNIAANPAIAGGTETFDIKDVGVHGRGGRVPGVAGLGAVGVLVGRPGVIGIGEQVGKGILHGVGGVHVKIKFRGADRTPGGAHVGLVNAGHERGFPIPVFIGRALDFVHDGNGAGAEGLQGREDDIPAGSGGNSAGLKGN